jgi:hypothetical protein
MRDLVDCVAQSAMMQYHCELSSFPVVPQSQIDFINDNLFAPVPSLQYLALQQLALHYGKVISSDRDGVNGNYLTTTSMMFRDLVPGGPFQTPSHPYKGLKLYHHTDSIFLLHPLAARQILCRLLGFQVGVRRSFSRTKFIYSLLAPAGLRLCSLDLRKTAAYELFANTPLQVVSPATHLNTHRAIADWVKYHSVQPGEDPQSSVSCSPCSSASSECVIMDDVIMDSASDLSAESSFSAHAASASAGSVSSDELIIADASSESADSAVSDLLPELLLPPADLLPELVLPPVLVNYSGPCACGCLGLRCCHTKLLDSDFCGLCSPVNGSSDPRYCECYCEGCFPFTEEQMPTRFLLTLAARCGSQCHCVLFQLDRSFSLSSIRVALVTQFDCARLCSAAQIQAMLEWPSDSSLVIYSNLRPPQAFQHFKAPASLRFLSATEMQLTMAHADNPNSASWVVGISPVLSRARQLFGNKLQSQPEPAPEVSVMDASSSSITVPASVATGLLATTLHEHLHYSDNQPTLPPVALDEHDIHAHRHSIYGYHNTDFDVLTEVQLVRQAALHSYNPGSTRVQNSYWKYWLGFCGERNLKVLRDDRPANEGIDRDGYQRELDILSAFLLYVIRHIKPKKGRAAALPSSALNVVRGVRSIHQKQFPPIVMVPLSAIKAVFNGIQRLYMRAHGYKSLLPKRREPWRRHQLHAIFRLRRKKTLELAGFQVKKKSLFWLSYWAYLETLAQSGARSCELICRIIKEWNKCDHATRASLVWCVSGDPTADPTEDQLDNLTEDDYAMILPPPSKTDAFGVKWGDKPIYLPIRFGAPYCAALRLRALERFYPIHGKQREVHPLFMDDLAQPITYRLAYNVLNSIKGKVLDEGSDHSCFTFHSFRVTLATQLGAMGCSAAQIQAMCRWQSEASLLIYNRMQPHRAIKLLTKAQDVHVTSYTAANLPMISSMQLAAYLPD